MYEFELLDDFPCFLIASITDCHQSLEKIYLVHILLYNCRSLMRPQDGKFLKIKKQMVQHVGKASRSKCELKRFNKFESTSDVRSADVTELKLR